jgi:hypothetical protein
MKTSFRIQQRKTGAEIKAGSLNGGSKGVENWLGKS